MDQLADEAGAGPTIRKYLSLRGIKTVPTLALTASTEEELQRHLLDPLFSGWTDGTNKVQVSGHEQPIARAIMVHMWSLARLAWKKTITPAVDPTPAPATGTTATAATSSSDKVPKELPPGVWTSLVKRYNSIQLDGRDRSFPVHELMGAEVILAKMWHEMNVSKNFSPIFLGDILQKRSFTASGDVNPLTKSSKRTTTLSVDSDHHLITTDEQSWSPKSLLSIIDGITSIKWAFILTQWGDEHSVTAYAEWMIQKARSRPQRCEQFVMYWQATAWTLAISLRNGDTFSEATAKIMKDLDRFNEFMAREIATDKKKPPVNDSNPIHKGGKSKGQKGGKGRGNQRWHPYRDQQQASQDQYQSSYNSWWNRSSSAWRYNNQYQDTQQSK